MRDDISLSQLEIFITCVRTGSFSAAARKLDRTQSVVSQTIAKLEAQIGVLLFDRSGRLPTLTDHGRALLAEARIVTGSVNNFKARARSLVAGEETELSIAVDALLPRAVLTRAVGSFKDRFPEVPLQLRIETLGAVAQLVLTGRCRIGVLGPLYVPTDALKVEPLLSVRAVTVVSSSHVLAAHAGVVSRALIAHHLQLVVSDRSTLTDGQEFGVLSPLTWRLADLEIKHEFLRAGFGWGRMPLHMVAQDIAAGVLKSIEVEGLPMEMQSFRLSSIHRRDNPPGPAGQWLIEQLGAA
jgi:DNA-binding transcriptional LysR family regulator